MSLHARWYDCPAFQEACLTVSDTGGAGFIGANFVLDWLSADDRPIVNLDKLNVRDWLYVGDHCAAIRLLLEQGKPGETHNIGGDSEMTNLDDVDEICSLLDELVENPQVISHKQLISYIEDIPGHDRRYAVNSDKIQIALAWEASETFQSGLRKTVQWYLNNADGIAEVESGEYRTLVDSHYGQEAVGQ